MKAAKETLMQFTTNHAHVQALPETKFHRGLNSPPPPPPRPRTTRLDKSERLSAFLALAFIGVYLSAQVARFLEVMGVIGGATP